MKENLRSSVCSVLPDLIEIAHNTLASTIAKSDQQHAFFLVDGTAGNGYDTLFLAQHAGLQNRILAFDIQPAALDQVRMRLATHNLLTERVMFCNTGHEHLQEILESIARKDECSPDILAAVFNTGFLPGSDRTITTKPETTIAALHAVTRFLCMHGLIAVHLYSGHAGGLEECTAVLDYANTLPWKTWRILSLSQHNKTKNKEYLILAEKVQA